MNEYYVSLGSNLGQRGDLLRSAVCAMSRYGLQVQKKSGIYETLPWGKEDQELFFNAVILVNWEGEPEELLHRLLMIEQEHGRKRMIHWGPRTLDLDLIYGKNITRDSEFLRLPHPFFWERAFVLVPLADIDPDFTFQGQPVSERIEELHGLDCVRRTDERWEVTNHDGN